MNRLDSAGSLSSRQAGRLHDRDLLLSRRALLRAIGGAPLLAGVATLAAAPLALAAEGAGDARSAESRSRAAAGYDNLNASLYEPSTGLYRFSDQGVTENGGYAFSWPFSAALMLVADMHRLTGDDRYSSEFRDRLRGMECYRDTRPLSESLQELGNPFLAEEDDYVRYGSGLRPSAEFKVAPSNNYFDDNAFYAVSLLSMVAETPDQGLADLARRIFNYGLKGINAAHASAPGGIVWIEQKDQLAARDLTANTNLAFGLVAGRLYELSGRPSFLAHARGLYDWTTRHLIGRTGLLGDRVAAGGLVDNDRSRWSYVSGLLVGLGALLYRATGEAQYLAEARSFNERASAFFTPDVLLRDQSPAFNAIYFRLRLFLASVSGDEGLRATVLSEMASYTDAEWTGPNFDTEYGLFRFKGSPEQVLEHSAMVQIAAMLAMEPDRHARLI